LDALGYGIWWGKGSLGSVRSARASDVSWGRLVGVGIWRVGGRRGNVLVCLVRGEGFGYLVLDVKFLVMGDAILVMLEYS